MMNDYGFSDIFRLCRGNDRVYTHFNKQYKTSSRLDFFLVDDNLVNFPVCTADISHGYSSDHSYISLRGPGGSPTLGWSKLSFLLFLIEGNPSYQMLFTGSKNIDPS